MSKTTYIVKSKEEELGDELFKVTVPAGTTSKEVYENFKMAAKYARYFDENDDPNDYDEHFEEMLEVRDNENGMYAFQHYMMLCGYTVEDLTYDFEFEW